ncbi:MAG TPA: N-acetylmuramoyl-L-alanine amidase [Sphingopyxis sp.]|jgi:hypothetical protein|uniref:N-acetylmuramoyl-L-alanine amidase n=1 Tax=Sphingopyxis sp. TaxID=1908224 RepID=UPI002E13D9FD|nr:N-acetylmuramoyl-L-alanine amidase [Sphingopyxis sp.]
MNLLEKTKMIQAKVGAAQDGIYGNATADKLLALLGLSPLPAESGSLVKGTGVNIKRVFLHCSATREGQDIDAATIKKWHLAQGWKDIGYHFVIRIDGTIETGRAEHVVGSHVAGFNTGSIGVVYVGGLDAQGKPKDTRTEAQKASMARLCRALDAAYKQPRFMGHRDASPDKDGDGVVEKHEWLKDCPCFDVASWWTGVK